MSKEACREKALVFAIVAIEGVESRRNGGVAQPMRAHLETGLGAELADDVEDAGACDPLASAAAVIVQSDEQGRVRCIGAAHSEPSRQGLLDVRRDGHRLAFAAAFAKHVKPLAHEVTMADIEAGNLAPPKAEPVGKPDDRCIARRLLRTPVDLSQRQGWPARPGGPALLCPGKACSSRPSLPGEAW